VEGDLHDVPVLIDAGDVGEQFLAEFGDFVGVMVLDGLREGDGVKLEKQKRTYFLIPRAGLGKVSVDEYSFGNIIDFLFGVALIVEGLDLKHGLNGFISDLFELGIEQLVGDVDLLMILQLCNETDVEFDGIELLGLFDHLIIIECPVNSYCLQ
jgi:hypothetical protein